MRRRTRINHDSIPKITKHENGTIYLTYKNKQGLYLTVREKGLKECIDKLTELQANGVTAKVDQIKVETITDIESLRGAVE